MLQDKPFIYAGTLFCDCYYFYHCTLSTAGFYLINCYNSATHFADIFCCCSNSNEKRDTLKMWLTKPFKVRWLMIDKRVCRLVSIEGQVT